MQWGEHVDWLASVTDDDEPIPRALADRPEVPPEQQFYWQAFWDLSGDRSFGPGAAGPIPFMALDRYAARYGIDTRDDFDRFRRLVKAMDAAWLSHVNKKQEAD